MSQQLLAGTPQITLNFFQISFQIAQLKLNKIIQIKKLWKRKNVDAVKK